MTDWTERWVPDAFIFALLATLLVVVAGVVFTPSKLPQVIDAWGKGFWELIPFTLQMALIIITGYVLASSPPVGRVIRAIAEIPTSPRNAVALVAFFAMTSSWFNWGFSLIFSAVLAKEVARRVEGVDYRALAAASFLGLGSVWAQGLSGSAALQMASAGALQPQIRDIVAAGGLVPGGMIPFRHTIFLWQSFVSVIIEVALVTLVMWLVTPPAGRGKTARDLRIDLGKAEIEPPVPAASLTPGQWLEHSPILNWLIVLLGGSYVVRYFLQAPEPLNAINLNIVNLTFLLLGFLLHRTPAHLMQAVQAATPAVWGVILQFPFYAGIAGVITSTHLSQQIAHAFVGISSARTFPPIVAIYSAVLGVFVPSGGSKWVVEAPYVMAAAHELKVHLGWVVASYDLGEALANLVQPFWMLP
ncbi:MAG: TIGR00366 family protein, partial [Verrucomicrobiota bacterium]|nr:TIGR00366 family protein [Verrucomicrobiota bacterium]